MAILTISRQFGSRGRDVCHGVVKELGYEFLDKEKLLGELTKKGTKWVKWGSGLDEHSPSIWERFDWSFRAFGALIKCLILEYASRDNVVIMGRGSNFILRDVSYSFRIRVVAPLEKRIETIMIRDNVDYQTASWLVKRTDEDRRRFLAVLYGINWDDPSSYDAVFDSSERSTDEIVRVCCDTLLTKNLLKTDLEEKTLHMRTAAAGLEAELLTDPSLFLFNLDVSIEKNHIVVEGTVRNPKHKKKIEQRALHLAPGYNIVFRLHYRV